MDANKIQMAANRDLKIYIFLKLTHVILKPKVKNKNVQRIVKDFFKLFT